MQERSFISLLFNSRIFISAKKSMFPEQNKKKKKGREINSIVREEGLKRNTAIKSG